MSSLPSALPGRDPDPSSSSFPAALAFALAQRHVVPPLVLSLVVSVALLTSYVALGSPLEGEAGAALRSLSERFLGNAYSRAILVLFLAAALYAVLQFLGMAIDRERLGRFATPFDTAPSWLAPLTGRPYRPEAGVKDGLAAPSTDACEIAERYRLQRRQHVEQGLAPLHYAVWVLPLLGFLGTVIGIARSITGLEGVIGSGGGNQASEGLMEVLHGLRFAFDTTLLGLVSVIPVMALLMILSGREEGLTEQGRDRVQGVLAELGTVETPGEPSVPVEDAPAVPGSRGAGEPG